KAGRLAPLHYIATGRDNWALDDFFASGEAMVRLHVDPWLAKTGLDQRSSTALDIGAGVGRLGRALSYRFSRVIALDIAPSMVAKGREINTDRPNLSFDVSSGSDLSAVATASCHFVLCVWVFQHIPNIETIESYVSEIHRVLHPGGS